MKNSLKWRDRPSFRKLAIPLVLGFVILAILGVSGAARSVGGINTSAIVVFAMALVRLVLIVPKRLDRHSFWKWAIPLVLGFVILAILDVSRAAIDVGFDAFVIPITAMALVRLVLIVLLAMALARRFRDIGWPAWIGPIILLVTMVGLPSLAVGYGAATYDSDVLFGWRPVVNRISDSVSLVLLIVAGSMPGKAARAQNTEVVHVFD